jgi:hypothetical protein
MAFAAHMINSEPMAPPALYKPFAVAIVWVVFPAYLGSPASRQIKELIAARLTNGAANDGGGISISRQVGM